MLAELPLHPKFVHLPIALATLMPLLSLGVLAAWWRGWFQQRTWSIVAVAQLLLVGSAFVAMRTGEGDEERVERVVAESAIELHEEAAEVFTWSAVGVLGLCLLPLLSRRPRIALATAGAATLGTVVVLGLGFEVGKAGGDLVYRHGAATAFAAAGGGATAVPIDATGHDDDDR